MSDIKPVELTLSSGLKLELALTTWNLRRLQRDAEIDFMGGDSVDLDDSSLVSRLPIILSCVSVDESLSAEDIARRLYPSDWPAAAEALVEAQKVAFGTAEEEEGRPTGEAEEPPSRPTSANSAASPFSSSE